MNYRLWTLLVVSCLLQSGCVGCGARKSLPDSPDVSITPGGGSTEHSILLGLSTWGLWIGGLAILAAAVLAFLTQRVKLAITVGGSGFALIIGSVILKWIALHIGLVVLIAVLAGVAYGLAQAFLHRKWLEKKLGRDLDGDGVIGENKNLDHA